MSTLGGGLDSRAGGSAESTELIVASVYYSESLAGKFHVVAGRPAEALARMDESSCRH